VWNEDSGFSCPEHIGIGPCSGYDTPVRQGDSCCYRFIANVPNC
jgi:hypothetical protein